MKVHEVDLCGQHLYLLLNGQALFDLYDKFGTKGFITDPIKGSGKKSFEAVCYYLFKLSEQGELYRRWQGQTHGPILTEQFFRVHLAPREVAAAKDAILTAIVLGFRREEKEAGDLDLGLVELQKKTGSPCRARIGCSCSRSFCGWICARACCSRRGRSWTCRSLRSGGAD